MVLVNASEPIADPRSDLFAAVLVKENHMQKCVCVCVLGTSAFLIEQVVACLPLLERISRR